MFRTSLLPALFLAATTLTAACESDYQPVECEGDTCDEAQVSPKLCMAIRGNGKRIGAHFASLARIVEHYGTISAAAGGSSASITIFLSESMQANPATTTCGSSECSPQERAARTALLLKSFPGYVQHLTSTPESAALGALAPFVQRVKAAGIDSLLDEDVDAGVAALSKVLEQDDLRDMINPAVIALLKNSPNPEMHARDVLEGIKSLGAFSSDSDKVFVRPGILGFEALSDKIGRVGDFYSQNIPWAPEKAKQLMESCATPGLGLAWSQVAALPAGDSTCGALFDSMVGDSRTKRLELGASLVSRIDSKVGALLPALISTSVLSGETAESFKQAQIDYNAARPYQFKPDFKDVSFGYWGQSDDLAKVAKNANGYDDLKTAMFTSLGETTWRQALAYSPAEPGLAQALPLADGRISAGGWSDLHPVLSLRNLGCEQVVYVTRTGEESKFAVGMAKLLGMDEAREQKLYSLDANSSFTLSLEESEAVWCTDWDSHSGTDLVAISADAYQAPMVSNSSFFTSGASPYSNQSATTERRGCGPKTSNGS